MIGKLKSYFETRDDIIFAFLFGSFVNNRETEYSDADIAVAFKKGYDFNKIRELWRNLENLLKRDVDLIILNESTPSVAWSALRGIPIIIRDKGLYFNYMLEVSREAEDFNEFIIDMWHMKQGRFLNF